MKRAFSGIGRALGLVFVLYLAACGTTRTGIGPSASGSPDDVALSCVLYARAVSGIDIRGDAYTWWDGAAGRYLRGQVPEAGAVLVLAKTDRLQLGHLAVVRQVIDDRDILVDHSNWVPGKIITGMQVQDVSPANDWTELRFFNRDYNAFGSIYLADGFIYQPIAMPTVGAVANPRSSGQLGLQAAAQ
ncbi:MAG TPA: CHAP domain-containing protein [Dongiaceae bacterium]|nr:CHAP domain-containing protein [Dongiaceae bacterium]